MKFSLFEKHYRKILLWSGAVALFITLLVLLILWAIPLPNKREKLMIGVQIVVNDFLIWFFLILGNRSRFFLRYLTQINVYRHHQQVHKITLSLQKSVYLSLFIFLAVLWLIETASFGLWTKSWSAAFTNYWWVTLIFFGINYFFLLIFWKSQIYLYNHDKRILHSLRHPENRSPV